MEIKPTHFIVGLIHCSHREKRLKVKNAFPEINYSSDFIYNSTSVACSCSFSEHELFCHLKCYYRPRSRGDNAFGSVCLFVCLSVCLSELSCLNSKRSSETQVSYTLKKHHRVCISRSIQNGWAFKVVVVSTGCAIAVDHAFNCVNYCRAPDEQGLQSTCQLLGGPRENFLMWSRYHK